MDSVKQKCQTNRSLETLWNPINSVMRASRQDKTIQAYDLPFDCSSSCSLLFYYFYECVFSAFVNWSKGHKSKTYAGLNRDNSSIPY